MKKASYEITATGNKYTLKKIIGQYNTKQEAAIIKRELLRKESEQREKETFIEARMKGLSRYF